MTSALKASSGKQLEYKVLIAASGVGSRLDELTKFTNKSLVRIGKKPAIGYIIDSIPTNITIVVTLGYFGDLVRDFIELCYPNRKFEFVDVENFNGPGSSMGHSLLCAEKFLQCPFIVTSCDTIIVQDLKVPDVNWLGVASTLDTAQYSTVICNGSKVVKLNDKGAAEFDFAYIGLAGIAEFDKFWSGLRRSKLADPSNMQLNDCNAFREMLATGSNFQFQIFDSWLDIGNSSSLRNSRQKIHDKFDNLEKLDESIYIYENSHIIKFFHNPEIVTKRVRRSKILSPCVPKITGFSKNFYKYDFEKGDLLSQKVNAQIFDQFLNWCQDILWIPTTLNGEEAITFQDACTTFYKNKTYDRLSKFFKGAGIDPGSCVINGEEYPHIFEDLSRIDWIDLARGEPVRMHGDLHFENVLVSELDNLYKFKLIDWRQDFGGIEEYGDVYYDLAKIKHGLLVSHEIVRENLYTIKINSDDILCDILRSDKIVHCEQKFNYFCNQYGYSREKIDIITALIFLNIAALHHYPYSNFLYYYGRICLRRIIEQKPLLRT